MCSPAHPRRCGENLRSSYSVHKKGGSSPQVRGKLTSRFKPLIAIRLIPAGAGKTDYVMTWVAYMTAHPRRCGENKESMSINDGSIGSSPQVRGKLHQEVQGLHEGRLIPAGAGKTAYQRRAWSWWTAHPRRCGENLLDFMGKLPPSGSSPQVRGKLWMLRLLRLVLRLIPAGAGKTVGARISAHSHPAHPRRCGENQTNTSCTAKLFGSSPQVRGKLSCVSWISNLCRLIPAGAGKTSSVSLIFLFLSAHPRRCGENRRFHQK